MQIGMKIPLKNDIKPHSLAYSLCSLTLQTYIISPTIGIKKHIIFKAIGISISSICLFSFPFYTFR